MNKISLRKTVMAALFAAITFVATYFAIPLPISFGYVNLGDCFVLLGGLLLGPYGFFSAALGSILGDILLGFIVYAPATFILKGSMALIMYFIAGKKYSLIKLILAAVLSECIMVIGYFIYECFVIGLGVSAIANIPYNCFQGVVCATAAIILYSVFEKSGLKRKLQL